MFIPIEKLEIDIEIELVNLDYYENYWNEPEVEIIKPTLIELTSLMGFEKKRWKLAIFKTNTDTECNFLWLYLKALSSKEIKKLIRNYVKHEYKTKLNKIRL